MSKNYLRAYSSEASLRDLQPGDPIRFTASTEGIKRDGMDLQAENWHLENFRKNPVFLWVHDYMGRLPPIGKVTDIAVKNKSVEVDVIFDQQDEFARTIESKYKRGFLNAVSVGWEDITVNDEKKFDLLDVSGVPVPGDPDALMERQYRALQEIFEDDNKMRAAIPPHSTPKAPEDASWDAGREVGQVEAERGALRKMFAWVDDEADPDTKRAYKLPHHRVSGEVVWRGVAAAMSRLFQQGTQIPDSQRRGVYNHLRRHYQQFDKEPPEFRTVDELQKLTPALIRGLLLEGEPEMFPWLFREYVFYRQEKEALKQAIDILQDVYALAETKEDDADNDQPVPDEADSPGVENLKKILEMLPDAADGENDNG